MAAHVDLYINSDETWEMDLTFWEGPDKTIPIDISDNSYDGAFNFGDKCIPITFKFDTGDVNILNCKIEAYLLSSIPGFGSYSITATNPDGDKYRIQQGKIIVDGGQVCS